MLKSCVGWALILIGLVVAGHMVIEPLYHVTDPEMPVNFVWEVINPVLAAAIILGCGAAYGEKRRTDSDETVSRSWIAANVYFYGLVAVALLFFWNWFNVLNPAFTGTHPAVVSAAWTVLDVAMPLLSISLGRRLVASGRPPAGC